MSLADFELVREDGPKYDAKSLQFVSKSIGEANDWRFKSVIAMDYNKHPDFMFQYGVSSSKGAIVVFSVFLETEPAGQRMLQVDIRLHELVLDSWIAEGGKRENLRYLAFHDIINDAARGCIKGDFVSQKFLSQKAKPQPGQTEITVTPESSIYWNLNPFLRSARHIAELSKAHLIWRHQDEAVIDLQRFFLVAEFNQEDQGDNSHKTALGECSVATRHGDDLRRRPA